MKVYGSAVTEEAMKDYNNNFHTIGMSKKKK